MAALTTVEGVHYNFDPGQVAAVSDHDPATGEAVTCVHGLFGTYLKIQESAQAFLARL